MKLNQSNIYVSIGEIIAFILGCAVFIGGTALIIYEIMNI